MGKKDKPEKKQGSKPPANLGNKRPRLNKAFCTECGQWYDPNNDAQFNKHAH